MNKSQKPEKCTIDFQLVLNRAWIYSDSAEDPVGEKNFVISKKYFLSIFPKLFPMEKDIDRFLDVYEPETDGEKIYQQAVRDGQIIEEFDSEIINEEVYDENNNQN